MPLPPPVTMPILPSNNCPVITDTLAVLPVCCESLFYPPRGIYAQCTRALKSELDKPITP